MSRPIVASQNIALAHTAFKRGNLPLADIICRVTQDETGESHELLFCLALIAMAARQHGFARSYLTRALALSPNYAPALEARARLLSLADPAPAPRPSYLLFKSWGFGFWANVDHVLGQLLLCEITGRIPVIHWGSNCLFGGSEQQSSFEYFFLPVSTLKIEDLKKLPEPFFPPKWSAKNLHNEDVNKFSGEYSRLAAIYSLSRPEALAVSDFHTGIVSVMPWLPASHPLAGKSIDDIYRHIIQSYLKPQPAIVDAVDSFYKQHLFGRPTLAVHIRGTDKFIESPKLPEVNKRYEKVIAEKLQQLPDARIFLLTDDANILLRYQQQYGQRLISTNAQRTAGTLGVHYLPVDRRQLGHEIMLDTYLAARCDHFIGNGASTVSAMIPFLKDWPTGACTLVSPNNSLKPNWFLHNW